MDSSDIACHRLLRQAEVGEGAIVVPVGDEPDAWRLRLSAWEDFQRGLIWLAGVLLVGGAVAGAIVGAFHAGGAKPNDHAAVFKQYAESDAWTAVHVLKFLCELIVIAGVIVLARVLVRIERARTLAVLIAVGAAVSAAAAGVVLAIDGVALKQTVDAWVSAVPGPEKAFAFHDAEVTRWLEWGANSFLATAEGLTYLLLGWAIVRTAIVPKWLGWLSAVAGLGFIAAAFVIGYKGFSDTLSAISVTAGLLFVIASIGIAFTAWRAKKLATRPPAVA